MNASIKDKDYRTSSKLKKEAPKQRSKKVDCNPNQASLSISAQRLEIEIGKVLSRSILMRIAFMAHKNSRMSSHLNRSYSRKDPPTARIANPDNLAPILQTYAFVKSLKMHHGN